MGVLNKVFFNIGLFSASNPCTACLFAIMATLICSLGFINYKLTVRSPFKFSLNRTILKISGFLSPQEQT